MRLLAHSTYTLNLYTFKSPKGWNLTKSLFLGVFVTIDLIIDVEKEVEISSGFHIKLNDGATLDIDLFAEKVNTLTLYVPNLLQFAHSAWMSANP